MPYHESNCYNQRKRLDRGHTLASLAHGYVTRTHAIDIRFSAGVNRTFRGVYYEQTDVTQQHYLTEQSCVIKSELFIG